MPKDPETPQQATNIKAADVEELARFAHLRLSQEECEQFAVQLDQIIRYAERIQELDTDSVEPTSHALLRAAACEPLRADTPSSNTSDGDTKPALERARLLEQAPQNGDGLFKVPKVLS